MLSAGLKVRIVRVLADISFKTATGWTTPFEAIVDTGNPITVIPSRIHRDISSQLLYSKNISLFGIGSGSVRGKLANVTLSLHDEQTFSQPFALKAYLLDDNSTPLILGYEDVLTELRMISDYPKQSANLEIS